MYPKYTYDSGEGHAPSYRERKPIGWTTMYHSDYLKAFATPLEETPYTFFSGTKIVIGFFGGSVPIQKSKIVSWDKVKTQVTAARLGINAHTDTSISNYTVYMNDDQIYRKDFGVNQFDDNPSVDVTNSLINGSNKIGVTFEIPLHPATFTITVTLYVEFTGITPGGGEDWWGDIVQWITDNQLTVAGIAGVGLAAVGAVIITRKRGRRRR